MTQKVLTTGIASGDEINYNFTKLFNKVGSNMSLDEYEVDKTGVNSSVRAISNFVADVGVGKANLPMAPGIYLIDSDYTIPSNINIVPEMGAVFYIASGVTLTINGSIEAGIWQIFSGDGSVKGSPYNTVIYPQWFGAKGNGSDDIIPIEKMLELCESGGRTVVFPYTTTGYSISDGILVDFSDISFKIYGNISYTGTTKKNVLDFKGTDSERLYNISVSGHNKFRAVLDGNCDNIVGYTYDSSDTYNIINCSYVDGINMKNLKMKNGLVNGLVTSHCKNIVIDNSEVDKTLFDNGFSINYSFSGESNFDEDDYDSWTNAVVSNCKAKNCMDFGFTNFVGSNIVFENCVSEKCGNNDLSQANRGGGYSVESYNNKGWDANTQFVNCYAYDCYGVGFLVQSNNVSLDINCKARKIKKTDDAGINKYGNGVTVLSRYNINISGHYDDCELSSIFYISDGVSSANCIKNFSIKDVLLEDSAIGINARGIRDISLINVKVKNIVADSPATIGSTFGAGIVISNDGATYNARGGFAKFENVRTIDTDTQGVLCKNIARVNVDGIEAVNPIRMSTANDKFGIGFTFVDDVKINNSEVLSTLTDAKNIQTKTCEAGTTETNITVENHGLSTGDYIINTTRSDAERYITVVNTNNFTVVSVSSQTTDDVIKINRKGLNYIKDETCEAGTTTTNITLTSHGLLTGDYIINTSRNDVKKYITFVDVDNFAVSEVIDQTSGDIIEVNRKGLNYIQTETCETGTTTTNIKITAHGLSTNDYIRNISRDNTIVSITVVDVDNFTVSAITGQTVGDRIEVMRTCEAGTTATNVKLTAHGLSTGDYIINTSRSDVKRYITKVDADNFTVVSVTGQTTGDAIAPYTTLLTTGYNFTNGTNCRASDIFTDAGTFELNNMINNYRNTWA